MLIGFDSLVFSESFEVKGVFNSGKKVVAEDDDSVNLTLVGQLL